MLLEVRFRKPRSELRLQLRDQEGNAVRRLVVSFQGTALAISHDLVLPLVYAVLHVVSRLSSYGLLAVAVACM